MKIIDVDNMGPIMVPQYVAKCRVCGNGVYIHEISEWIAETGELEDSWIGFSIDCISFPGFDDEQKLYEFQASHWQNPYSDWLPLMAPVGKWFNANFRVKIDKAMPTPPPRARKRNDDEDQAQDSAHTQSRKRGGGGRKKGN